MIARQRNNHRRDYGRDGHCRGAGFGDADYVLNVNEPRLD